MKQAFYETMVSDDRDPIEPHDADREFDYEALFRILDNELPEDERDKQLQELVVRLLLLLVPTKQRRLFPRSLGLRLLAIAWVLNPSFFVDTPSLRELAQRAGVTPAKLSRHTGRFSRMLRLRHRGQSHAWNWDKGQRSDLG